jgi:hypothetical protein
VIRPLSVDNPTSAGNRRGRADAIVKLWTPYPPSLRSRAPDQGSGAGLAGQRAPAA